MMKFGVASREKWRPELISASVDSYPYGAISSVPWRYAIGFWPFRPTGTTFLILTMTISASPLGAVPRRIDPVTSAR